MALEPTEIEAILNSGSPEEFLRLVPALKEGMAELWAQEAKEWEAQKENPYGAPLTREVHLRGYSKPGEDYTSLDRGAALHMEQVRIFAHKGAIVEGVEYSVIASHCYDEYDFHRSNHRDEGRIHVVLLAERTQPEAENEGRLYIITGSYYYLFKNEDWEDNYSIPGYPEGGSIYPNGDPVPGLLHESLVPFEEVIPQLALAHKGYGNYADTPQIFNVKGFKEDLYNIAMLPSRV